MDNKHKLLGEEKIYKLLIKFSVPGIIGMLVNALYNVVDRIFVGQTVGPNGIAGIVASFPIMLIAMAFAMLIGIGTTSLLSIRLGQQRHEEAEKILANGLTLLIGISVLLSVIGFIFVEPLLTLVGAKGEVLTNAINYSRIILIGNIFQFISFGMNHSIRAQGKPRTAMATMLIGAISNIILDYILVVILGYGMQGAAIATAISQAISAIWILHFFLSGRSSIKIHAKNLILQKAIVFKIVTIGMAPFLLQLANSVMQVILNRSLEHYGDLSHIGYENAIAAFGIVGSISTLLLMPLFGLNQGVSPIIGYNYGAQKYNRVRETLKLGILSATVIVTVSYTVAQLFPEQLIRMFVDSEKITPELIEFGIKAIHINFFALPIIGVQILGSNFFQATGRPVYSSILSLSRQIILLIPLLLILPLIFGLDGILYSIPLADIGSTLLTSFFILFEMKKLHRKELQVQSDLQLNIE